MSVYSIMLCRRALSVSRSKTCFICIISINPRKKEKEIVKMQDSGSFIIHRDMGRKATQKLKRLFPKKWKKVRLQWANSLSDEDLNFLTNVWWPGDSVLHIEEKAEACMPENILPALRYACYNRLLRSSFAAGSADLNASMTQMNHAKKQWLQAYFKYW